MLTERLYIKEMLPVFGCKDKRTCRRWCVNHGVRIFSDTGSKRQYVIKAEFEIAKDQIPKKYLNQKYGMSDFSEAFNAHSNFFVEYKTVMEEKNKKHLTGYKPQGEIEKMILKRLTGKLPEL